MEQAAIGMNESDKDKWASRNEDRDTVEDIFQQPQFNSQHY